MSVKQTNLVGVSVKEVYAWQRCPPSCVVYYIELYTWQECPPLKGSIIQIHCIYTWQRCEHYGGVYHTDLWVSIKQNCTTDRDVHLPESFVHLTGVSIFKRWLQYSCSPNRVWTFQGCHISHVHLTAGVPITESCAPSGVWIWKGCPPCRSVWQTWCQSPPKKVVHLIDVDTHLTRNVCS